MTSPSPASRAEPTLRQGAERPAVLRVDNLSKRFGAFWALQGASFSIRPGEILGLIGPNGSGKTTLFECLAGLSPATVGTVTHDGTLIGSDERKQFLYFVPDGIRPFPDQTVDWILRFSAGVNGVRREYLTDVIDSLRLDVLRGARLGDLSKGEHRRVMLAVGLLTPQKLLMLDEPFDGLDLRQTRDVMGVLRNHAAVGRTLFLSIHQLGDANRICDRLVLLSGGHVAGEGTLDELRSKAGLSEGGLEEVFLALT
ncbi:MAG TPA: ABC transporter ATP-binding protein [Gemmatimonadaceae bacterium]|nr:ABC transporter ATP-binding protein [Gemmatimonadaceae bacterium]